MDCICDILCADGARSADDDVTRSSERVRSEAAGVIAQITSPSLLLSPHVDEIRRSSLMNNMADIVPALTSMMMLVMISNSNIMYTRYLKIICNFFSYVEVNFSTSVLNINKSI